MIPSSSAVANNANQYSNTNLFGKARSWLHNHDRPIIAVEGIVLIGIGYMNQSVGQTPYLTPIAATAGLAAIGLALFGYNNEEKNKTIPTKITRTVTTFVAPQFREENQEVDYLKGRISELEGEKEALQSENSKLRGENLGYVTQMSQLHAAAQQIDSFKNRIGELEQTNLQFQDTLRQRNGEIAQLKIAKKAVPIPQVVSVPVDRSEEIAELNRKIKQLSSFLKQKDEQIAGLNTRVENMSEEMKNLEGVKDASKRKEAKITKLTAEVSELRELNQSQFDELTRKASQRNLA